jgi:class 3 adenylate cyclase
MNPTNASYSKKFYNVKILKGYVSYLKVKCGWTDEKVEQLFELCHQDITFLDSDDHWFDQFMADLFIDTLEKMTGDPQVAYKAGQYGFSAYALGIQGRLWQSLVSPQFIFKNIGKYSLDYSRGAIIQAIETSPTTAVLRSTPVEGCGEKPYQCQNRRGMLEAVPPFFSSQQTFIGEEKCVHRGDAYCEYHISWKNVKKFPVPFAAGFAAFLAGAAFYWATGHLVFSALTGLNISLFAYFCLSNQSFQKLQRLISEKDEALNEALRLFHRRYEEDALKKKIVFNTFQVSSLDSLCHIAAEAIKDSMKYDRVLIMLADKEKNVLKTAGSVGFEGDLKEMIEMAEFNIDPENNQGFFIRVFNTQTPLFIRDTLKKMDQLSLRTQRLLKLLGTKAFIAVPIVVSGGSAGILAVENTDPSQKLVNDDMDLLMEISKSIGLAISNQQHFQVVERSEKLAKALEQQERQLRQTFQKFVPDEVASRLRHFGGQFLSVQKKTVDVMFVDIMNFTGLSESNAPEEVVDILNIYIDEVQKTVKRFNGRINKIIGDGLLIYFDEIGSNAIQAGYAILQACHSINARLQAKGYSSVSIGIGAHRGVCTIGYIGTDERLDYTLIGDTVNIAARLQGYTRKVGPNTFCFSSSLQDEAVDFECISRGKVLLKGKRKYVEIFQLGKPIRNKQISAVQQAFYRQSREPKKIELEDGFVLELQEVKKLLPNRFN